MSGEISGIRLEAVLDGVRKLEAAGALGSGGRLPALLRYLVQEEFAGRGDRLKAYAIATDVFGRGSTFDPQQDSIVRVEIARLRKAIDYYFATEGQSEPVKLAIPRGSYRLQIMADDASPPGSEQTEPAATESPGGRVAVHDASERPMPARSSAFARSHAAPVGLSVVVVAIFGIAFLGVVVLSVISGTRFWIDGRSTPVAPASNAVPKLIVLPVVTDQRDPESRVLALGLRTQFAGELSLQKWLSVSLMETFETSQPVPPNVFTVSSVLSRDAIGHVLSVLLHREPDRTVVWSGTFSSSHLYEPMHSLATSLYVQLARVVGHQLVTPESASSATPDAVHSQAEEQFQCMMSVHRYWSGIEMMQRADARECLQRLIGKYPNFSEGRATLALLAIYDARRAVGEARKNYFETAESLLSNASEDDRLQLNARMTLRACLGDTDATKVLARRLFALAPNDTNLLASIAEKAGLSALDWDFALEAEARAFQLSARPTSRYMHATAAKAVMEGDYNRALQSMSRVPQSGHLGQTMLLTIATLADAPLLSQSATAVLGPGKSIDTKTLVQSIDRTCWHDDVKAAFRKAIYMAAEMAAGGPGKANLSTDH